MPYAERIIGIYKIVNKANGKCYVGQSQNLLKRVAEHFRLLRRGHHTNPRLQHAFNKYGEANFKWEIEATCTDLADIDAIEEAFLRGEAWFEEPTFYNIADFAKAPMRGKTHTEESKEKMRQKRLQGAHKYESPEYHKKLREAQMRRHLARPEYVDKVKIVLENFGKVSQSECARRAGIESRDVKRVFNLYQHLQGAL